MIDISLAYQVVLALHLLVHLCHQMMEILKCLKIKLIGIKVTLYCSPNTQQETWYLSHDSRYWVVLLKVRNITLVLGRCSNVILLTFKLVLPGGY